VTFIFALQEVELNLDNYQIVHLGPGMSASVNEKSLPLAENVVAEIADGAGTLLLQVEAAQTPERLISVDMPAHGFHVIYTGSSTLIMVSLNHSQSEYSLHAVTFFLHYLNLYTL
jgi:hypothetical protein